MSGENEIEITVNVDADTGALTDVDTAAQRMGDAVDDAAEKVNRSMGRARDSLGRFVKEGTSGGDSVARKLSDIEGAANKVGRVADEFGKQFVKGLSGAADSAADFLTKIGQVGFTTAAAGAAGTAASGGMNILVGALATAAATVPALIGGFLALAPALLAAGGAAGAAASAIAGIGAVGAVLKIGLGGVIDAWQAYGKATAGGGGASSNAAKQIEAANRAVEQAEYSLTQAKRQSQAASEDVTRARENEIERLEDLTLAIRGQKFAQEDALKALKDAEAKRAQVNAYGNEEEKKAAQDAVDRAQYQYDYVTERLQDLQQEKAKADKDGIDGSDQVKAALDRQRDANERVVQAAQALADAQKRVGEASGAGGASGGIDAFNEAMKKLSPNARDFVKTMIDISKKFDDIKRKVQDRLFAGLDDSLRNLAEKWLPKLEPMLGKVADSLNFLFKGVANALGDKDFMSGIETAVDAFSDVIKNDISPAIDHVIHAFGILAGGSTEPLKTIGGWIERIAEKFDDWVTSAAKSGELKTFMQKAADSLQKIWDIGGKAFEVIGQIVGILFPGSEEASGGVLDKVYEALDKTSKWLADPKNQKSVQGWIDKFVDFIGFVVDLADAIDDLARTWVAAMRPIYRAITLLGQMFRDDYKLIVRIAGDLIDVFKALPGRVTRAVRGLWDGIKEGFRSALNWIVDRWNSLSFTLPQVSFLGLNFGGNTVGVPNIGHFASGGAGSGLAIAGEYGRELIRLPTGSSVMTHGDTERALAGLGGGGGTFLLRPAPGASRDLMQVLIEGLRYEVDRNGQGSVQRLLGNPNVTT